MDERGRFQAFGCSNVPTTNDPRRSFRLIQPTVRCSAGTDGGVQPQLGLQCAGYPTLVRKFEPNGSFQYGERVLATRFCRSRFPIADISWLKLRSASVDVVMKKI